jgi:hypothetical protein
MVVLGIKQCFNIGHIIIGQLSFVFYEPYLLYACIHQMPIFLIIYSRTLFLSSCFVSCMKKIIINQIIRLYNRALKHLLNLNMSNMDICGQFACLAGYRIMPFLVGVRIV